MHPHHTHIIQISYTPDFHKHKLHTCHFMLYTIYHRPHHTRIHRYVYHIYLQHVSHVAYIILTSLLTTRTTYKHMPLFISAVAGAMEKSRYLQGPRGKVEENIRRAWSGYRRFQRVSFPMESSIYLKTPF